MNMQLMLGVGVLCYFVTLALICFYRDKINVKAGNVIFIIADVILYLLWNIAYAENGWLQDGFMTLENISPFIFTVIPMTVFLHPKAKDFAYSAIAFLHLGLFLATLISPEYVVIFNYRTEATFAYTAEAMCHLVSSLFGLYLILTEQVKPDFRHWLKSLAFLLGWISFGVALNLILDTHCFNMNPNRYGIYMLDIFDSFWATLAAYYLGVIALLTLGMQTGFAWKKLVDKIKPHHENTAEPSAVTPADAPAEQTQATDAVEVP